MVSWRVTSNNISLASQLSEMSVTPAQCRFTHMNKYPPITSFFKIIFFQSFHILSRRNKLILEEHSGLRSIISM